MKYRMLSTFLLLAVAGCTVPAAKGPDLPPVAAPAPVNPPAAIPVKPDPAADPAKTAAKPAAAALKETVPAPVPRDAGLVKAEAFANAFFAALQHHDFQLWQPAISPEMSRRIDEKLFRKMSSDLERGFGKVESASYVTMLDQGQVRDYLWKLRFTKTEKRVSTPREIIFFVRVSTDDRGVAIGGFGFKPF